MPLTEKQVEELTAKLKYGFKLAQQRMIEFKKQKGTKIVISKDDKILHLTPEEFEEFLRNKQ